MLNKLTKMLRDYAMVTPGDTVYCAVSGGADSVALLFSMYLLAPKLKLQVRAAHFNHCLRGEESDRDEAFVRELCARYDIPLEVGTARVVSGKKGLEAAAREARYAFFATLPGKIATAHTADDNAETVLMHLVRGTGLKGLGGISPVRGNLIRPMLLVTREQVLAFLDSYYLSYVSDSSNASDVFLRNRLRHRVMPLLREENPKLAQNVSASALRLREDEAALTVAVTGTSLEVSFLCALPQAMRNRALAAFLQNCGVPEPEASHITLAEKLVFSPKPSARAMLPGGVVLRREYGRLTGEAAPQPIAQTPLACPGITHLPGLGIRVICREGTEGTSGKHCFNVLPKGQIVLRHRLSGDAMRLPGGTKSLKKLFVDRKIPAHLRLLTAVIADDAGVLGVDGIGVNLDRESQAAGAVRIRIEQVTDSEMLREIQEVTHDQ